MRGLFLSQISASESLVNNQTSDKLLFGSFSCMFFFIPLATSPAVIAGLLSLCIWIFTGKVVKDRHKWLHQDWIKPVILFMLLPLIGLIWTEDVSLGLIFVKKSYYWFYAVAIVSACAVYPPRVLVNAYLAGLSVNVLVSLLQYAGFVPMLKGYPAGFMSHISYSLLLVFGMLLLSFYFSKVMNPKYRVFFLVLMAAYALNLIVNIGRIGYLAFIIVLPWILYNMLGRKHIIKVAAASIAGIIILSFSPTVQERTKVAVDEIKAYYEGNKNTSVGRRPYMWKGALNMFLENPVLGVGTGGYQKALAKYRDDPELPQMVHPHNTFLYIASSFGIAGLLPFFWLLAVFLRKGWHTRNTVEGFAVLSYGVVIIIGSMTDTQVLSVSTGMTFALLTGMGDYR